jgi:hypothetical protein
VQDVGVGGGAVETAPVVAGAELDEVAEPQPAAATATPTTATAARIDFMTPPLMFLVAETARTVACLAACKPSQAGVLGRPRTSSRCAASPVQLDANAYRFSPAIQERAHDRDHH